jgi:hypothetical protein
LFSGKRSQASKTVMRLGIYITGKVHNVCHNKVIVTRTGRLTVVRRGIPGAAIFWQEMA